MYVPTPNLKTDEGFLHPSRSCLTAALQEARRLGDGRSSENRTGGGGRLADGALCRDPLPALIPTASIKEYKAHVPILWQETKGGRHRPFDGLGGHSAYDNPVVESLVAILKAELVGRERRPLCRRSSG
jgi:hypothetical protein